MILGINRIVLENHVHNPNQIEELETLKLRTEN